MIELITIVIYALISLINLGYGIAEAVILSNSTDAKGECGAAIWYCILVLCIVHFISAVTTPCIAFVNANTSEEAGGSGGSNWVGFGLSIWACVIYFDTNPDCKDYFLNEHADLWQMVEVEVITFFIIIGLLVTAVCIGCCIICTNPEKKSQEVNIPEKQARFSGVVIQPSAPPASDEE